MGLMSSSGSLSAASPRARPFHAERNDAVPVFERPLVALSLTKPDVNLLQYVALALPACGCEEVVFAHVLPDHDGTPDAATVAATTARITDEVRRHLEKLSSKVRFSFEVLQGTRLDQLLGLAARKNRDVILLGHRRARSGKRSLASRLAMLAPCSVWLVPEGSRVSLRNLLAPIDFSKNSADSLGVAASLASMAGVKRINAVHVYFDPSTVRYDEYVLEVLGKEEETFRSFLAPIDTHGVAVEPVFEESTHTADAILRVAGRTGTDLIVMCTRGRSRAAAVLLGSVTAQTITQTSIPLLAVKHFGGKMTMLQALLDSHFWGKETPKTN
jgi:nucleotide-binding universal stress UspA family protein